MRKAHAARHRRLATKAREAERARRIQAAIEVEERRHAEKKAYWEMVRPLFMGGPITPLPWSETVLTNAAPIRLRGE